MLYGFNLPTEQLNQKKVKNGKMENDKRLNLGRASRDRVHFICRFFFPLYNILFMRLL